MSYRHTSNQTADMSQLTVQMDITARGYISSVPCSRDSAYDLIVDRGNHRFETLQIKTISDHILRCTTRPKQEHSVVSGSGKPRNNHHYRDLGIDWLVGVKDGRCYYYSSSTFSQHDVINIRDIPPEEFGYTEVRSHMTRDTTSGIISPETEISLF